LITVSQIAESLKGEIVGDPDLVVNGVCELENGVDGKISFLSGPSYFRYFNTSRVSVVIVNSDFDLPANGKTLIKVGNPVYGFARVLEMFSERPEYPSGVDKKASIGKASLGDHVTIAPLAVVADGVIAGDGCYIGSGSYVGSKCILGKNVTIHANVTLYDGVIVGNNVTIDAGTVIGADGFGWVTVEGKHRKIPQIGTVRIGNDVWIGANCTIDRGTFKDTIIGDGTKLDNLIQIGHNASIGKHCLFAAQLGVAGSTTIGDYVTIAGQVGIVDHITIGDRCVIASKTAVFNSLKPGSFVSGIPARDHKSRLRQDVIINRLPELMKRIRTLEAQIIKGTGKE